VTFTISSPAPWLKADGRKLLAFVAAVRHDIRDLRPRDMIDLQSFLWVQVRTNIPTDAGSVGRKSGASQRSLSNN
jgi:hypothetical protein